MARLNAAESNPGIGRRVVASLWAAAALPYLVLALWVPIARALGVFASVPIPALVVASVLAGPLLVAWRPRLAAPLPESLDRWLDPPIRIAPILWVLGGLFALFSLGKMAVFLGDPRLARYSLDPSNEFLVRHSCLTAYMHGAILSKIPGANVYDMTFVDTVRDVDLPPTAAQFAPFRLDAFGYPPPFLLLSRGLLWLAPDWPSQRLLFSAASFLLVLYACAAVAKTLGGEAERRAWLLAPVFLASPPLLATLQVGNFHLAAVAICLLCWVALEKRRDGLAGTLLAIATLAKIFPGLLGVVLLVQRKWRAAGFTALAAVVLSLLSVPVLGARVWRDFLFYQLPRVQSGEALAFLAAAPQEIELNLAPFGLPFKLAELGFSGWGWAQARTIGSVYTVVLVALAVLAARNRGSAQHRLTVWLGLVMLGSLRSPYAAPFVLLTVGLLFLALVAELGSWRAGTVFAAGCVVFLLPLTVPDPHFRMVISLARTLALYVLLVWVVVRKDSGVATPGPLVLTSAATIGSRHVG